MPDFNFNFNIPQGKINDLNRYFNQTGYTSRQQGIARPVMAGGTGDPDLMGLGYGAPELQGWNLIQEAPQGAACGYITIMNSADFLPEGSTHLVHPASPFLTGNTWLTKNAVPPHSIDPMPGVCGEVGTPAAWDYVKRTYQGTTYWYTPSRNKVWDSTTNTFADPPWPAGYFS